MEILKEASKEAMIGCINQEGGPFGAIITDSNGTIISRGHNKVLSTHDPTNHAEIVAIRDACLKLATHDLSGYILYSSCEPCPMCLSAIVWANLSKVYYGATRKDAASAGFRDDALYDYFLGKNELLKLEYVSCLECEDVLKKYKGEIY